MDRGITWLLRVAPRPDGAPPPRVWSADGDSRDVAIPTVGSWALGGGGSHEGLNRERERARSLIIAAHKPPEALPL